MSVNSAHEDLVEKEVDPVVPLFQGMIFTGLMGVANLIVWWVWLILWHLTKVENFARTNVR
eukprot:UN14974